MSSEAVKNMIKACIVSRKGGMPLCDINKDYRDLVGENIPYAALGYRSLEDFLRSINFVNITRQFAGDSILKVSDPKVSHIENMINKQKNPKSKGKNKRRRYNRKDRVQSDYRADNNRRLQSNNRANNNHVRPENKQQANNNHVQFGNSANNYRIQSDNNRFDNNRLQPNNRTNNQYDQFDNKQQTNNNYVEFGNSANNYRAQPDDRANFDQYQYNPMPRCNESPPNVSYSRAETFGGNTREEYAQSKWCPYKPDARETSRQIRTENRQMNRLNNFNAARMGIEDYCATSPRTYYGNPWDYRSHFAYMASMEEDMYYYQSQQEMRYAENTSRSWGYQSRGSYDRNVPKGGNNGGFQNSTCAMEFRRTPGSNFHAQRTTNQY